MGVHGGEAQNAEYNWQERGDIWKSKTIINSVCRRAEGHRTEAIHSDAAIFRDSAALNLDVAATRRISDLPGRKMNLADPAGIELDSTRHVKEEYILLSFRNLTCIRKNFVRARNATPTRLRLPQRCAKLWLINEGDDRDWFHCVSGKLYIPNE